MCALVYLFSVLMILSASVSLVPVFAATEDPHGSKNDNDTETETVKVGYYENEVFEEGASPDAVKRGYAYEYYRKMSEYTGWNYEYVYGGFNELYDIIDNLKVTGSPAVQVTDVSSIASVEKSRPKTNMGFV